MNGSGSGSGRVNGLDGDVLLVSDGNIGSREHSHDCTKACQGLSDATSCQSQVCDHLDDLRQVCQYRFFF